MALRLISPMMPSSGTPAARCSIRAALPVTIPKRFTVNADRLFAGHGTHGAVVAVCLCGALGDAPVGFASGVFVMIDVAALVGEDALNELIEFGGHKKSLY